MALRRAEWIADVFPPQFNALRKAIAAAQQAVAALPDDSSSVADIEAETQQLAAQLASKR